MKNIFVYSKYYFLIKNKILDIIPKKHTTVYLSLKYKRLILYINIIIKIFFLNNKLYFLLKAFMLHKVKGQLSTGETSSLLMLKAQLSNNNH